MIMIDLSGLWTQAQLRALEQAGWIGEETEYVAIDVTSLADTLPWFIIVKRGNHVFYNNTLHDCHVVERPRPWWEKLGWITL